MLLELPRHDDLARCIDLGELAAAVVDASICKDNGDAPLTADAEVRGPFRLAVEVGVSPPPLDLVSGQRAEDAFGWHCNLRGRDDRASPAVGHRARCAPLRSVRHSEIDFRFHPIVIFFLAGFDRRETYTAY